MTNFITAAAPQHPVTAEELQQVILYFEQLEAQRQALADQQKELLATAKGRGYNVKVIRRIISLRKRDMEDLAEEEHLEELYRSSLGM